MRTRILHAIESYIKSNFSRTSTRQWNQDEPLGCLGLGLDSVEIMTMFFDLEDAFQIEISSGDYYKIHTENELAAYMESRLQGQSIVQLSGQYGEKIAVTVDGRRITYGEFGRDIKNTVSQLKKTGIISEDCILLALKNSYEYAVIFFAVLECNAVPVLADWTANHELSVIADDSRAAYVISERNGGPFETFAYSGDFMGFEFWKKGEVEKKNWVLRDACLIHYTSGSTGRPNGVVHDIASYRNMITHFRKAMHYTGEEVLLLALPISHGYGLSCVFLSGLYSGSELVMMRQFQPADAIALIEEYQVTHLFAVPPMFELMNKVLRRNPHSLTSLLYCCSSSLQLHPSVVREFYFATGKVINQEYGSAETGVISFSDDTVPPKDTNCVGKPLYPRHYKVTDEGELLISSPEKASGYSSGKKMGRWYDTGDLVEIRDDKLFLRGRIKNMLVCGGRKVFAEEIQADLLKIEQVKEAYVCQKKEDSGSCYIRAFLVWEEGVSMSRQEIIERLRSEIDPYKIPGQFVSVPKILTNEIGKVTQQCVEDMEKISVIL